MKGVILAGGLGTRLHPITLEIPKSLLTVKKKPIINYLINLFFRYGIEDTTVLINEQNREDFDWWQKRYGSALPGNLNIKSETKLRGTFGGLQSLQEELNGTFLLTNGDEIKDFNLNELIAFHKNNPDKPLATIALVEVANPSDYGVPVMAGDCIKEFLEKPKTRRGGGPPKFISSGLYVLEPGVFQYADWSKEFLMIEKDIFPKLAADGKLCGYKIKNGRWQDCGNFERWEKAIKEW